MKPFTTTEKPYFINVLPNENRINRCDDVVTTLIKTHIPPIKDKEICVHHNNVQGLFASIRLLDTKEQPSSGYIDLPLRGVPKSVLERNNVCDFKKFFSHTNLIPMKNSEGFYDKVEVHLSLKGGMRAKIPFQPCLDLGYVVSGECIEKMEEYAKFSANASAIEDQVSNVEHRIDELEQKIKSKQAANNLSEKPIYNCLIEH